MTALPRFHTTSTTEGPAVVDRVLGLRATFRGLGGAIQTTGILNRDPRMIALFNWAPNE